MISLISLSFMILFLSEVSLEKKFVFVATHFRHGAREPLKIDSEYKDLFGNYWGYPEELTGVGQRMHFTLGLRNRKRYVDSGFLTDPYDPHEFVIYSTDHNRTIVSAFAQLQGLFPMSYGSVTGKAKALSSKQVENSMPKWFKEATKTSLKSELEDLGNEALPNKLILEPLRLLDRKYNRIILAFEKEPCLEKGEEYKAVNNNSEPIVSIVNDFNAKYGSFFNSHFKDPTGTKYDRAYLNSICDAFYSGQSENLPLLSVTDSKGTKVSEADFEKDCEKVFNAGIRYWIYGDKNKDIALMEGSKMFGVIVDLIKVRLNATIKGTLGEINATRTDYSKPKYLMISAHDSSVGGFEMFLIAALGLDEEKSYRTPNFASQGAIEVYYDESKTPSSYEDFNISYYFNEDEIVTMNAKQFLDKIEKAIWSGEKIDSFCGVSQKRMISAVDTQKKDDDDEDSHSHTGYITAIAILAVSIVLLLITKIFLVLKAKRKSTLNLSTTTTSVVPITTSFDKPVLSTDAQITNPELSVH